MRNIFTVNDIISPMSKIKLVEDAKDLHCLSEKLSSVDWIGIDTEFLREKTYYPLLCLVQVHSEIGEWSIDTVKIDDLSSFADIIGNPAITKIFHSCRQDFEALNQRISTPVRNLYDTQLAASFIGCRDQISYAALVSDVTGVELEKTQTRTDWSARPLSDSQISYAIEDVRYLDRIRQYMNQQLQSLGRLDWYQQECQRILDNPDYVIDPAQAWRRLKGAAKIPVGNQPIARELAIWREQRAQKRDRPREWIVPTRAIIQIATVKPDNLESLSRIDGMTHGMVRNAGQEILNILNKHPTETSTETIWSDYQPLDREQKSRCKIAMKRLRQIAEQQQISLSLLANRSDIESFILDNRIINLMQGWRYEIAGKEIESI